MTRRYEEIGAPPEKTGALRLAYAQAAEDEAGTLTGSEAADLWVEAMGLYARLDDPERSLHCGRNALECDPNSQRVREKLARCLTVLGHFAEAEEHLKWLLSRKPNDVALQNELREVFRKRLQSEGPMASPGQHDTYLR
jgi:tetratricopeptide (TPR) repeat protein